MRILIYIVLLKLIFEKWFTKVLNFKIGLHKTKIRPERRVNEENVLFGWDGRYYVNVKSTLRLVL